MKNLFLKTCQRKIFDLWKNHCAPFPHFHIHYMYRKTHTPSNKPTQSKIFKIQSNLKHPAESAWCCNHPYTTHSLYTSPRWHWPWLRQFPGVQLQGDRVQCIFTGTHRRYQVGGGRTTLHFWWTWPTSSQPFVHPPLREDSRGLR